jgi:hypothetical protein
MEGISCRSDHFGVVEVPDTQKDRDLKTYGRTIHLKCDTNLLILLASCIYLDACHCDLKFAHFVTRIRETHAGLNVVRSVGCQVGLKITRFLSALQTCFCASSRFIRLGLATSHITFLCRKGGRVVSTNSAQLQ